MITKREFSSVDASPNVMYGKRDGDDTQTFPVAITEGGALLISKGMNIPIHDYISISYVSSGYGVGEPEVVVFKNGGSGGTVVATLTLTYGVDNNISSITRT